MSNKPDPIIPKDFEVFEALGGSPADFILRVTALGDVEHSVVLTRGQAELLIDKLRSKIQT